MIDRVRHLTVCHFPGPAYEGDLIRTASECLHNHPAKCARPWRRHLLPHPRRAEQRHAYDGFVPVVVAATILGECDACILNLSCSGFATELLREVVDLRGTR